MVAYRTYKAEVLAPQVRMLSDEIAFNVALSLLSFIGLYSWFMVVDGFSLLLLLFLPLFESCNFSLTHGLLFSNYVYSYWLTFTLIDSCLLFYNHVYSY